MKDKLTLVIVMLYSLIMACHYRFAPEYNCTITNANIIDGFVYYFLMHGIVFYFALDKYLRCNIGLIRVSLLTLLCYEGLLILFQCYLAISSITNYYSIINSLKLCQILSVLCFLNNLTVLITNIKQKK